MTKPTKPELLEALYWMYVQYCSDGHSFMGAGEKASELLENAGYLQTNGAGQILRHTPPKKGK